MLALAPLLVPGASAFEFFGIKLFEDQSEIDADAVIGDPQTYTATVETAATGDVANAIRGASALLADQGAPASGAAGLLAKARGDYQEIEARAREIDIRENLIKAARRRRTCRPIPICPIP